MGCSYHFVCKGCKIDFDLGYGSYSTWIRANSTEEYEAEKSDHKDLWKNMNLEKCLREHRGHDFVVLCWDWVYRSLGDLGLVDEIIIYDFDKGYKHVDMFDEVD